MDGIAEPRTDAASSWSTFSWLIWTRSLHVPSRAWPQQPHHYAGWNGRIACIARLVREQARKFGSRARTAGELEAERGALFLMVPCLLAVGAITYFTMRGEPSLFPLAAVIGAAAGALFLSRSRRPLFLLCAAVLLLAVGVLSGKLEALRASTKMLGSEVTTRLTARVVRTDRLANGRIRYVLDVVGTERPALRYSPERVRLTGHAAALPPAGALVKGLARLMPPSGPIMPGGYDFSFESYFDGIGATGFFLGAPTILPSGMASGAERGPSLGDRIEAGRDRVAQRIRNRIGGAEGEIAAALIVGTRGGIPEPVNEALRRTGLAHVLSISGLHMALVAATVMGTMRALFALFPVFAARRPVKKYAAGGGLLAVCAYVLFSGADVAALRSFVMLAIMLAAVLFDRAALTMRNLAISAILILLWSPHEVLGPSFQMSFAATAALVAAYGTWADFRAGRIAPPRGRERGWLLAGRKGASLAVALGATSLIAGTATAAFGVFHFQRVSPLSLPANLLVMPVVSTLVMPFGLAAMLAMPFGLDGPFLDVMGFGLRLMIGIAEWISNRSPIDAVGTIPVAAVVAVALAIAVLSVATTWLRCLAIPLALAGLFLAPTADPPDLLISEDGRLAVVALDKGRLAVNAQRGGGFTLENWQRAMARSTVLRPVEQDAIPDAAKDRATAAPEGFSCRADGLCAVTTSSGAKVAYAQNKVPAADACRAATVAVVATTILAPACKVKNRPKLVVTRRDLALKGSAAVRFSPGKPYAAPTILFAISQPLRPWHTNRRFSRAARGLEEPDRKMRPTKTLGNDRGLEAASHENSEERTKVRPTLAEANTASRSRDEASSD